MRTLLITCITALLLLSSFSTRKKTKLKLPGEFAYVPGGTFSPAIPADEPYYNSRKTTDSSRIVSISGFYMSKYEVTNLQYRQFYAEASAGMTDEEKEKIICDTLGWRQQLTYCEPMKEYYYRHPAYNTYPVVNISHEGAIKYCEWLQQQIQKDNPEFIIEVKLPTKNHWIYAAMGGRSQAMYPWGNYYLRNKKGEFLCNFKRIGDQAIVRNRETGKPEVSQENMGYAGAEFFTASVKSFYPNDFGLYNMCGNAAEMINENGICMGGSWNDYGGDVTTRSEADYKISAPTVGFRPIIIVREK